MKDKLPRRDFINKLTLTGAGMAVGLPLITFAADDKPAILGGPKAHPGSFPDWPVFDQREEKGLINVLNSKKWGRLNGNVVSTFEKEYQKLLGVQHCLGVSSGTSALYTMLGTMDIGPGDEVIIPVYTFIATYNVEEVN